MTPVTLEEFKYISSIAELQAKFCRVKPKQRKSLSIYLLEEVFEFKVYSYFKFYKELESSLVREQLTTDITIRKYSNKTTERLIH